MTDTTYTVTATDSSVPPQTATKTVVLTSTGGVVPINFGETTILATNDNGNGNLIVAQQAVLSTPGVLTTLSFYVTAVGGKLRLGLYANASGVPGAKIAETAEFTPVAGWNTVSTLTSPSLVAGIYWLVYFPQSNALGFRNGSGPNSVLKTLTYGALPATFPTGTSPTPSHWSFYGTVNGVAPPPPPPPPGGFPDASTTGVRSGVTLTTHNGDLAINTPGAVISGLDIHGTVSIDAANVTLVNCKITTSHSNALIGISASGVGATIQDCELNGGGSSAYGILNRSGGTGNTYLRCNIHGSENGIDPGNGDTVQDSYIWGLLNTDNAGPHYDGIEFDGGSNLTIRHNTIIAPNDQNSAVMIDNYFWPVSNVIVDNNRLAGGSFTIFVDGRFSGGSITGVQITNNRFTVTNNGAISVNAASPVFTGNVDDVTGAVISLP